MQEEQEGKPLLLIEVIEDPGDKKMPHKLKINWDTVKALSGSTEKYVRYDRYPKDCSCLNLWTISIRKVVLGQPAGATNERIPSGRNHPSLYKGHLDLVISNRFGG